MEKILTSHFMLKIQKGRYSVAGKFLRKIDFDKILYRIGLKKVKHISLTKYVRKYGSEENVLSVIADSDVDCHIGELPPELLNLIDKDNRSAKTKEFFKALDRLVVTKGRELSKHKHHVYSLQEIGKIFGTYSFLQTAEEIKFYDNEYKTWGGSFGDVYKISFPEIGGEYALKIYKPLARRVRKEWIKHGANYEIPTAFCANKSEPRENNRVYMAKLNGHEYLLSRWVNKEEKSILRYKNRIFETSWAERQAARDNFINGIRVDYGDTYRLDYGYLSYDGRKWYRKMQAENLYTIKYEYGKLKNNFDKRSFYEAMELFFLEYINNNKLNLTYNQQAEIREMVKNNQIEIFDKYFKKSFPPICR